MYHRFPPIELAKRRMMMLPLIDLLAEYQAIRPEVDDAIATALASGMWILGPNVAAFEREMAASLGADHAIGLASGTDALILALRALGIGPGDEVLVPVYSFYATAEAVQSVGATPMFVDIAPSSYCIDVARAERAVTSRTKAIIPVHLYGHPADMTAVRSFAAAHGLAVVEDAAQAFGATWEGQPVGALGDIACFSFFPTKNLGGFGDGGMLVTSDEAIASQVRLLHQHGSQERHRPQVVGMNSRLDELQAAALRVKLPHVDGWNERRRIAASRYDSALAPLGVTTPTSAPEASHVYHLYVIESTERDAIQEALTEASISSAIYYPQPMHLLPACASLGGKVGDFPVAEDVANRVLALPMFSQITGEQVDRVCEVIALAVEGGP